MTRPRYSYVIDPKPGAKLQVYDIMDNEGDETHTARMIAHTTSIKHARLIVDALNRCRAGEWFEHVGYNKQWNDRSGAWEHSAPASVS